MCAGILTILQGLATPAIAAASVVIAWQQKRLADIRLRNDLFDRRVRTYDAAQKLIRCAIRELPVPLEDLQEYLFAINSAEFLFPPDVVSYLRKLQSIVGRLNISQARISQSGGSNTSAVNEKDKLLQWLVDQIGQGTESGEMTGAFKHSISLDPPGRFAARLRDWWQRLQAERTDQPDN
jgi:hypothetical protein